jgi:hypothetical protein
MEEYGMAGIMAAKLLRSEEYGMVGIMAAKMLQSEK